MIQGLYVYFTDCCSNVNYTDLHAHKVKRYYYIHKIYSFPYNKFTFKKYYICFFIKYEHVTSIKAVLEFNFVFCHGTWQNNKCEQFLKCKSNFMHKSSG